MGLRKLLQNHMRKTDHHIDASIRQPGVLQSDPSLDSHPVRGQPSNTDLARGAATPSAAAPSAAASSAACSPFGHPSGRVPIPWWTSLFACVDNSNLVISSCMRRSMRRCRPSTVQYLLDEAKAAIVKSQGKADGRILQRVLLFLLTYAVQTKDGGDFPTRRSWVSTIR